LDGSQSPFEINIDKESCKEFKNIFSLAEDEKKTIVLYNNKPLEKVTMTVKVNLSDTISRFKTTSHFITHEKTLLTEKIQKEELNITF
jgi:hypothetical protein